MTPFRRLGLRSPAAPPPQTPPAPRVHPRPDDSTLPPADLSTFSRGGPGFELAALVILWSRDEPDRAGQVFLVPADERPEPWVLGRGAPVAPDERRLLPFIQRPGHTISRPPLASPRISRSHLRLSATGPLRVENAGKSRLLVNGNLTERAELVPGDTIEIQNELLLLVARRPAELPGWSVGDLATGVFGAPDAFGIVGESPAIWELRRQIVAAAQTAAHVLVLGPSGTGKELIARALHAAGPQGKKPLVARNAATIPEGLAAAELFGNIRSYPNPGTPERPGLVGQAHGSTLFLDELPELSAAVQAQLLRVLDAGEYQRVGEAVSRTSDLRLVAATNRPPREIKHDLLARLKIHLVAPELDARREDIPLLAERLLREHLARSPQAVSRFFDDAEEGRARLAPSLITTLVRHRYSTHVRELDALLLESALHSRSRYLELTDGVRKLLSAEPNKASPPPAAPAPIDPPAAIEEETSADAVFSPAERRTLGVLRKHRFRPSAAALDPAFLGNRQTADLHLRQLIAKALRVAAWAREGAARILAGPTPNPEVTAKAISRIDTFLSHLETRIRDAGPEGQEALSRALTREWRASSGHVLAVVEAITTKKIR